MLTFLRSKKLFLAIALTAIIVTAGLIIWVIRSPDNSNQPILAGQNIIVTVTADSFEDMYAYQFNLNYDEEELEYHNQVTSKIKDITFAFSNPVNDHELVGGTMVGENAGVSGKNKPVCEMVFTAKKDGVLGDFSLSINAINVVKIVESEMEYIEDIDGWQLKTALAKEV